MADIEKNNGIHDKGKETRERRNQSARAFEIKFDKGEILKQKLTI